MDKEITKVIFRQWKIGCEIIALFPEIPANRQGYDCQSYMRVGQHGPASPDIIKDTKPAIITDGACQKLFNELTELGYNLKVVKKFTYAMQKKRMTMCK